LFGLLAIDHLLGHLRDLRVILKKLSLSNPLISGPFHIVKQAHERTTLIDDLLQYIDTAIEIGSFNHLLKLLGRDLLSLA